MGHEVNEVKIAISGYYGFDNSGDEAVLQSILLALEEEGDRQGIRIEPIVLSANPERTEQVYGVRAAHRMRFGELVRALYECDGLISGGGSLLQDATGVKTIPYYLAVLKLAQLLRKRTFVYAQGVGPIRRSLFHPMVRAVFRKCDYISVRDEESADLLGTLGVDRSSMEVVPDPVMGLSTGDKQPYAAQSASDGPIIGVSVRFWNEDRSELDGIAQALHLMMKQRDDMRIRFLPFHLPADTEASRYVVQKMAAYGSAYSDKLQIDERATHPQQMLAEVGSCDLLIGMRLHSLIYAAGQRVAMAGISYDPKIDRFLHQLGERPNASVSVPDAEQIAREALALLDRREQWLAEKDEAVDNLRKKARRPAQQIVELLRPT